MQFSFQIATKVLFGRGCIAENRDEFRKLGKRAVVVTGRNSGKASGALDDIEQALKDTGVEFTVFDGIDNNPSLENVEEAGKFAAGFKPDFIVGVGGGSPLDAAKAVATLAVNDMPPEELFKNSFAVRPLPIVAVPTTAGTGSEVTPYSIITRKDLQTKMSFGNADTFPKLAFMDAAYTETLSYETTVNTAVDALSHAIEGYLSRRSTFMSDVFAVEAMALFGECLEGLLKNKIDFNLREKLLYMAMLGGMVISHTATTIVHGMGYSLTYFLDIPHGRANGLLLAEYLKFNRDAVEEKTKKVLSLLGMASIEEFRKVTDTLMGNDLQLGEEQMEQFASLAMKQKSAGYNIKRVEKQDLIKIYRASCKGV